MEMPMLKYRRQYVLTPKNIDCPFISNTLRLNKGYILYAHKDLNITEFTKDNTRLILLGDIFDYEPYHKNNLEVLKEIIDQDFIKVVKNTEKYTGRFVIIYQYNEDIRLFNDSTATRKIYYSKIDNLLYFGSQPYLLAKILNLEETKNPSKLEFYNSSDFVRLNNSNIGDTTIFDDIFQVLPNHCIAINDGIPSRYWPYMLLESYDIEDTVKKCAEIIKGYLDNIISRNSVMLPVTAGKDSRLLLAATKENVNNVYYYINKENRLSLKSVDIKIPKSLLSKLGIEFHIVDPYINIDEGFKKAYFENNHKASSKYLPLIYNYYKNYANKINLPGNIAFAAQNRYKFQHLSINPQTLSIINKVHKYKFAKEYYSRWYNECVEICNKYNLNILNLFYWEERLANWGSQIAIDKDIAQEDINPYNSRLLISLFLGVDVRLLVGPKYTFHKMIINHLWPEVLKVPINPSLKSSFKNILSSLGLLSVISRIKNRF